jgi:HEAT repeat protein
MKRTTLLAVLALALPALAALAGEEDRGHYCETPAEYVAAFESMLRSPDRSREDWIKYMPGPAMLDTQEIPALLLLLGSKEWEAREWACSALARRKEKSAVEPLIKLLGDEKRRVQEAAVSALGWIGDPRAVEPLLALLAAQKDVPEQVIAKTGVKVEGGGGVLVGPGPDGGVQAKPTGPVLEAALVKVDGLSYHLARALGRLGDRRAVPVLLAALQSPSTYTRRYAAWSLGQLGAAEAAEPLGKLLDTRDKYALREILVALGRVKAAASGDAVMARLKSEDWEIRGAAAESLGWMGERRAVPALAVVLKEDRMAPVRAAAAEALGRLGDPQAVAALKAALGDRARAVCAAAAKALYDFKDPQGLEALFKLFRDSEEGGLDHPVTEAFLAMGKEAVPHMLAGLQDKDFNVSRNCGLVLGRIADPPTAQVIQLLDNKDPRVRMSACMALERIGDPAAVAPLLRLLDDADLRIWQAAEQALGKIGRPAVPALIQAAAASAAKPRGFAAMGLIRDLRLVPVLLGYLSHPDAKFRSAAVHALSMQYSNKVRPALVGMLGDRDPGVRRDVIWVLRFVPGVALADFLRMLDDPVPAVRSSAAAALRDGAVPEAIPALERRIAAEGDADAKSTMQSALEACRRREEILKKNPPKPQPKPRPPEEPREF